MEGVLSASLRRPFDLIREGVAAGVAQTAAAIEGERSRTDRVQALSTPTSDGSRIRKRPSRSTRRTKWRTGSGARTRTVNLAVNSRLLYRLSYSGAAAIDSTRHPSGSRAGSRPGGGA